MKVPTVTIVVIVKKHQKGYLCELQQYLAKLLAILQSPRLFPTTSKTASSHHDQLLVTFTWK